MNNKVLIIISGGIVWYFIIGYIWFLINKYIIRNNRSWLLCTFPVTGLWVRFGLAGVISAFICHWLGLVDILPDAD
jgi:hypothetical protein